MLIKLLEIYNEASNSANSNELRKKFLIREIVINSKYVICLKEDKALEPFLKKGFLPQGLNQEQKFTNISVMRGQIGLDITVVGSLETVLQIINGNINNKDLLKG